MMMPTIAHRVFNLACLAFLIRIVSPVAHGQSAWKPTVELTTSGNTVTLSINRQPALVFEHLDAPWALRERPRIVAKKLANLIAQGFNPRWIIAKDTPQGTLVLAGGAPLLTVTDSEARAKGMTRQSLAETWAATLRELLLKKPLSATPERLVLPFGETRSLQLEGTAQGAIQCVLSPENLAAVSVDPATRKISLTGVSIGAGSLAVVVGDTKIDVPVLVRRYAGRVERGAVSVTGNGPGRTALKTVIENAVERAILREPDARVLIDAAAIRVPTVIPPQGTTLSIPVRLEGVNYLPVQADARIRLSREEVGRTEPNLLFYSNDPEMLRKYYGVLYNGIIHSNQAVRFLYHHQSAMPAPIRFTLQLLNGNEPARIQVIDGAATPQIDTFQIGHRAAAKFFPLWLNDSGYIQEMAPGETITLLHQILRKDVTSSGIFHFVLLAGSEVTVQLRADPPDLSPEVRPAKINPEVYPTTRKKIDTRYTVGGRWSFLSFGREPVTNRDSAHPLAGNYGVLYDMTIRLENPTDQRNAADIVFDPSAGTARGVFLVDGKMIETDHLRPPQEYVLGSYPLQPGDQKEVRILTMPLAGSNYPARITVRPRFAIAKKTP